MTGLAQASRTRGDFPQTPALRYAEEPDSSRARSGSSAYLRAGVYSRRLAGFTLIELLVVIGIITVLVALAIPAVLISRKKGIDIRAKADLTTIAQALDAYKADFGTYPALADPVTMAVESGNAQWLDYSQERGAVLLCRSLLGPGPAVANNGTQTYTPGDDGADGPGFRVRRNYIANGSTYSIAGKVYGPYIDSGKFKVKYVTDPNFSFSQAYPVLLDLNGNPILYYPASPGNPTTSLNNILPTDNGQTPPSRFNGYDNQGLFDAKNSGNFTGSSFAQLAANTGSLPYLLWTPGQDGVFGMVPGSVPSGATATGKSDDITNFDLPANLKK